MTANSLADYPAQTTKSIPDATLLFGDWSQVILLKWGQLEIGVDPESGRVGIRSLWTTDPESFCNRPALRTCTLW
jgi:hypothetical protein